MARAPTSKPRQVRKAATPKPQPTGFYNPESSLATRSDIGQAREQAAPEHVRASALGDYQEPKAAPAPYQEPTGDFQVSSGPDFDPDSTDPRQLAAEIARIREFRKPLGGYNLKLDLPKRRGYHRHWFNDSAGRVDQASANGWTHVKGRDGKPIRRNVGRVGGEGGSSFAYAMEIPLVFYDEDMATKHQIATDRVDAIRQRPAVAKAGDSKKEDAGKFYNPHEDKGDPISIQKSNPQPL